MGCRCEKNNCKNDCLCRLLRNFIGQNVFIHTKSGENITGRLENVTNDCCVELIEPAMITPLIGEQLTVIRCRDIESFSVELLT